MSPPTCLGAESNTARGEPVHRRDLFDLLYAASPWPLLMLGHDGHVIGASDDAAGTASLLRERAPHYLAALRGPAPWLEPQQAIVETSQPGGRVQRESLHLRRMPWGACLTIAPAPAEAARTDPQTERLAALGFMVAGVCHEIANPLTSVHSVVQMLRAEPPPGPELLDKGLRNVAVNVKRILDISRRLSTFARVGDEPRVRFALDEALDEALVVLRHQGLLQAVRLDRRRDASVTVMGNVGQAREVFLNLLLNAVQAMGSEGQLVVATRRAGTHGEVSIADSGPGVPAALRERVFEAFFTTKGGQQGTGLGLAISREIVIEHGGTLELHEAEGGGADFVVRMPVAAP